MLLDAEFWIAIAFLAFVAILLHLGVHRKIGNALNNRQARIRLELDEARQLRDEAQRILAEYQRKKGDSESQAAAIMASAEAEVQQIAADARSKLAEFVARRTKLTELKIAQAKERAFSDVRSAAVDLAVAAAERVLVKQAKKDSASHFIRSLGDVKEKFERLPRTGM
jgi:F-type H+-transporting ATPase subunit b